MATPTLKFTKEQIMGSVRYIGKRDLLNALLDEDKNYTIAEVDKLLKNYYEKEV